MVYLKIDVWASSAAAGRYVELDFPVVSESIVHQRYLTLFNRRIRFPAVGTRLVRSGAAADISCFAWCMVALG